MICSILRKIFGKKEEKKPEAPKKEEKKTGYQIAQKYIGRNELENSKWINLAWKKWGRSYDYRTEWCSLFILECEDEAGNIIEEHVPDNFEVARSWWNTQMPGYVKVGIEDVKYGDIVITKRGESWQGHVGYFGGFRGATQFYCLGGNKQDQVKMGYLSRDKIVGIIRYVA